MLKSESDSQELTMFLCDRGP